MLEKLGVVILSQYEFKTKPIKQKENKVVEDLSRHTNLIFASSSHESDLENQVLNA